MFRASNIPWKYTIVEHSLTEVSKEGKMRNKQYSTNKKKAKTKKKKKKKKKKTRGP